MIQYLYLGRVAYDEALRLQAELVELRQQGRIENLLLLLEHPPVLTLGRNADRSNVLATDELLARRGITLHEINRGGDVTYHGPGQLIGYPIFDLRSLRSPAAGNRLGPVDFVRLMEEALIRLCGEFGVSAGRICGLTGVWCGLPDASSSAECSTGTNQNQSRPEAKIAAIGIHVARGVTSHGFALNVTTDLDYFGLINPCGITDRPVTSLAKEVGRRENSPESLPSLESLAHRAARQFGLVFNEKVQVIESLAALRTQAAASEAPPEPPIPILQAPAFPGNDAPLQVPPEIERLQGKAKRGEAVRPVRA